MALLSELEALVALSDSVLACRLVGLLGVMKVLRLACYLAEVLVNQSVLMSAELLADPLVEQ
jgi:hypothetical protein